MPKGFNQKPTSKKRGLLVFGGSGGRPPESDAHDIAALGHVGLTLDYFDFQKNVLTDQGYVSHFLSQVPIERFKAGVDYLKSLGIPAKNITLLGESRGGEGAMVLAAYLGNQMGIGAVIGNRPLQYAASEYVGKNSIMKGKRESSSWTLNGKDIPFMPKLINNNDFNGLLHQTAIEAGAADKVIYNGKEVYRLEILHGWLKWLEHNDKNGAIGRIPVENFNGRVITIGSDEDKLWPAAEAVKALSNARKGHSHDFHVIVKGAGHVRIGNRKSTYSESQQAFFYPGLGLMINGGTPQINSMYDIINQWIIRSVVEERSMSKPPFADILKVLN